MESFRLVIVKEKYLESEVRRREKETVGSLEERHIQYCCRCSFPSSNRLLQSQYNEINQNLVSMGHMCYVCVLETVCSGTW